MSDAAFQSYAVSLNVNQRDICEISWNLDAAEGLGILKTEDAANGEVTVYTTGSMLDDLLSMIEGLKKENINIVLKDVMKMEKAVKI